MRALVLTLFPLVWAATLLPGCRGSLLNPYDASQKPRVEVKHTVATDPPVIMWAPPDAAWVEVREASSGRVMWRVEEAAGRLGTVPVRSPLAYGAGLPPDVNPPDNTEPRSTVGPKPLGPAMRYTVTVHRRDERAAASGSGFTGLRPNRYETTVTFTTSNTIPMD